MQGRKDGAQRLRVETWRRRAGAWGRKAAQAQGGGSIARGTGHQQQITAQGLDGKGSLVWETGPLVSDPI